MRPSLPFGVKRRIKVESASLFLKAVERQACTISLPGMVCSIRPDRAPPTALNFEPLLALIAAFPPVNAPCVLGLRYIEYKSLDEAGSVTDCLTIRGTKLFLPDLFLLRQEPFVHDLDERVGLPELAPFLVELARGLRREHLLECLARLRHRLDSPADRPDHLAIRDPSPLAPDPPPPPHSPGVVLPTP